MVDALQRWRTVRVNFEDKRYLVSFMDGTVVRVTNAHTRQGLTPVLRLLWERGRTKSTRVAEIIRAAKEIGQ